MDSIQDHLRITNEMMIDQLCDTLLTDVAGVSITHERLFLPLNLMTSKLKEIERLGNVLMTMHGETKAVSN